MTRAALAAALVALLLLAAAPARAEVVVAVMPFADLSAARAPVGEALRETGAEEHVLAARMFVILGLAERGDFALARPLADKLLEDSDEWDQELRQVMSEWPTD